MGSLEMPDTLQKKSGPIIGVQRVVAKTTKSEHILVFVRLSGFHLHGFRHLKTQVPTTYYSENIENKLFFIVEPLLGQQVGKNL